MDLEGLGYLIRDAREGIGMSQAELGRKVGLSRGSISLLEVGGTKNPKMSLLTKLAQILNIAPSQLYEKAGVSLPDAESQTLQWLSEEMDVPNRRRLIAIGHALLQEQKRQPQRANRSGARRPPEGQ
jgi:transcriptional regulator with XRE-family HTH domain